MFGFDDMFGFDVRSKRLWRSLLGVLVAYAVAAHSLLITLGGFAPSAHVNAAPSTFDLCLHDGQDGSELPTSNPDRHGGYTHCFFCLAGCDHPVMSPPPVVYHRTFVKGVEVPLLRACERLPQLFAYAIANPRGPPLGA
jgi:hypothetical protein